MIFVHQLSTKVKSYEGLLTAWPATEDHDPANFGGEKAGGRDAARNGASSAVEEAKESPAAQAQRMFEQAVAAGDGSERTLAIRRQNKGEIDLRRPADACVDAGG